MLQKVSGYVKEEEKNVAPKDGAANMSPTSLWTALLLAQLAILSFVLLYLSVFFSPFFLSFSLLQQLKMAARLLGTEIPVGSC